MGQDHHCESLLVYIVTAQPTPVCGELRGNFSTVTARTTPTVLLATTVPNGISLVMSRFEGFGRH